MDRTEHKVFVVTMTWGRTMGLRQTLGVHATEENHIMLGRA